MTFEQAQKLANPTGIEIYDTKANPRVKWTCRKCGQRNDAKLIIPLDPVVVKFCQKCKKVMRFEREKTYKIFRWPDCDKITVFHSNAKNKSEGVDYTGEEIKKLEAEIAKLENVENYKLDLDDQGNLKQLYLEGKARDKKAKRDAKS